MASPFKEWAAKYVARGLSPLPLKVGEKRPIIQGWQRWCEKEVDQDTLAGWEKQYGNCNLGLALGTKVWQDLQLIAIDIDADDLVAKVEKALGAKEPAKVGKKGKTIFALAASKESQNQKFRRVGAMAPSVEILGIGSQTVLPPSIHPDTGKPYSWLGINILETPWERLPIATEWILDEIQAHCAGKGEHIDALNTMVWLGVGAGGNTHDTCVSAVASLVARGWPDTAILERIKRAKREACERHGDTLNWPQADQTISEWIESARAKGMTDKVKKKQIPPERVMAEWLYTHLGGRDELWARQGQILKYRDGFWPEIKPEELRTLMYAQDNTLKQQEAKAALGILYDRLSTEAFQGHSFTGICVANGTLDFKTGRLEQWDPGHRLLHQLPFEWQEDAHCPTYNHLVSYVLGENQESIQFWDEFAALTLVDDMSFEKVLFLLGNGANGKSTLARVLIGMHNPAAVSSISITDLGDERKRSSLVGKLINIASEQSRLNVLSDTYLKKITGGDGVEIRFLYKEIQNNVRLSVRFIETVNEMPGTSDHTDALRRRLVILKCPNKLPDGQQKRGYDRQILSSEGPGILVRLVTALQSLYARGRFAVPEASRVFVEDYLIDNDPVHLWMVQRTEPDYRGTPSSELYADFRDWQQISGMSRYALSVVQWGSRVTQLGYASEIARRGRVSQRIRKLRVRPGMETPI